MKKKLYLLSLIACLGVQEVNAQCTVQASATANSPLCEGSTLNLAGNVTGNVGACTYQWQGPNMMIYSGQNWTIGNVTQAYNGMYVLIVTDINSCTDTAYVNVSISPVPSAPTTTPAVICLNDMYTLTAGGQNLLWYATQVGGTGYSSMTATTTAYGNYSYWVSQTVNGCEGPRASLTATVVDCDSVWPGDVNYDLIADNNDVLDLGLAYGNTGGVRGGASNNWVAQNCFNWGTLQVCNQDMKHADCNGDGTVDANDTAAINLNYGQVHLKGEHVPQGKSTSSPDLYFDLTGINFTAGTTVSVPIKLGTSSFPMSNIMGIAANVHVSNITLTNAPSIEATTSWMGNGSNLLNFTKGVSTNQTDWTLVRTDHANVSGDGTIATLTMDIPVGVQGQEVVLYLDDVRMIDNGGTEITNYNVIDDTATVLNVTTAAMATNSAIIIPNPSGATATLSIQQESASRLHITVTDVTGRSVWNSEQKVMAGLNSILLPATELAAGTYFVKISGENAAANLKWQKK